MKPEIISHRINTIKQLRLTPSCFGVEIDLRSRGSRIILQHDPFCKGESLERWLKYYQHGTIILNVKEEGLEKEVLRILSEHHVRDYFFLDVSFPFLIALSKQGKKKLAVRFSEYESLDTVLRMKGLAEYVWVDCFSRLPLNRKNYNEIKKAGFKICIVSPELQKHPISQISVYAAFLKEQKIVVDAVCTKHPDLWETIT